MRGERACISRLAGRQPDRTNRGRVVRQLRQTLITQALAAIAAAAAAAAVRAQVQVGEVELAVARADADRATALLGTVWEAVAFRSPARVVVYSDSQPTGCGMLGPENAFYCKPDD